MSVVPRLRAVVRRSFCATHAGRSIGDLVSDDAPNAALIGAGHEELPTGTTYELNGELDNLRRRPPGIGRVATGKTRDQHDDYLQASEIVARHVDDKHARTIDQVRFDPDMRQQFDTWHIQAT